MANVYRHSPLGRQRHLIPHLTIDLRRSKNLARASHQQAQDVVFLGCQRHGFAVQRNDLRLVIQFYAAAAELAALYGTTAQLQIAPQL